MLFLASESLSDKKAKMKKMKFITVVFLGVLMTGCSTSKIDGIAVGNVSNSECLQKGRTRGDSDRSWGPRLILTREGDNIVGEIKNYEVNCGHRDLIVTCKQDGSNLTITVKEEEPKEDGDISKTSCLCPVNIYFTIYDIEGDLFHVNLEGNDFGNASFKEGNRAELTVIVHENVVIQE